MINDNENEAEIDLGLDMAINKLSIKCVSGQCWLYVLSNT